MNKKGIPLKILKEFNQTVKGIKSFVKKHSFIEVQHLSYNSINIIDSDKNSNFYFNITIIRLTNGSFSYRKTEKPKSQSSAFVVSDSTYSLHNSIFDLEVWTDIVKQYNDLHFSDEEKIIGEYSNEFFTEFEIIDEDADEKPFNLQQQLYLDRYLETIQTTLKKYPEDEEIAEILEETTELKENLTKETKKSIIKKFSRILAKVRKHSLKLLQEIYSEVKKQIIKKIVSGSFEGIETLLPPM